MSQAGPIGPGYRGESGDLDPDVRMAALARRQHGVVSRGQLLGLGLTSSAIERRRARGRLHPLHLGVYAVGHTALTRHGRWLGAVLACGPEAVLSHRSAGALHGLRPDHRAAIDIMSPHGTGRDRSGLRAHRARLPLTHTTSVDGIPCTSVERTLLDLAGQIDRRSLERAIEQAEILRALDWRVLEGLAQRAGPRRGTANLRELVARRLVDPGATRSELERRFLDICALEGLPRPIVNSTIALSAETLEVDFLWPQAKVIAETDGLATHGTPSAFERDRRRDQLLSAAGYRVVRFTWAQVVEEPEAVSRTLRTLVAGDR